MKQPLNHSAVMMERLAFLEQFVMENITHQSPLGARRMRKCLYLFYIKWKYVTF